MDQAGNEDKLTIISQMFWIAVSMLESDYEYEFSLAVRLLDKVGILFVILQIQVMNMNFHWLAYE